MYIRFIKKILPICVHKIQLFSNILRSKLNDLNIYCHYLWSFAAYLESYGYSRGTKLIVSRQNGHWPVFGHLQLYELVNPLNMAISTLKNGNQDETDLDNAPN